MSDDFAQASPEVLAERSAPVGDKRCSNCLVTQSIDQFVKWSRGKDGRYPTCKGCRQKMNERLRTEGGKGYKGRSKRDYFAAPSQRMAIEMANRPGGRCVCGETAVKHRAGGACGDYFERGL